jgi:hypothetical protein
MRSFSFLINMNIVGSLHKVSDEKLRVKEDKTSWAVRLEGHSVFLPGQWPCAIWSKIMQPVVLLALPGKGLCEKKPIV